MTDILLRAMEPTDLELLYTIENDPEMWDVGTSATPYSRHTLHQHIRSMSADISESGDLRFVIDIPTPSDSTAGNAPSRTAIGLIDLTNYDARTQRAEVSIAILRSYRNKGYGTRALLELVRHCDRYLHMHQLYAIINTHNSASQAIFQQAGFAPTATLLHWIFTDGMYQNAVVFQKIMQKP